MKRGYLVSLFASLAVLAACVFAPLAHASSGRGTLYSVTALGGSPGSYRLTVSTTTGISVGDHVLASTAGGGSGVYLVTATTSTTVTVVDSLTEGGDPGAPVGAGTAFAWSTPTSGGYTLIPDQALYWTCALRRNAALASAGTAAPQNANVVFSGPSSGGAAAPTFRALVAADLPSLSSVYVPVGRTITATSPLTIGGGASADLSADRTLALGTVTTANGGTGLTSYSAGDVPYYASGTALSKLGIGSANLELYSTGSAPAWRTTSAQIDAAIGSTRGAILYRGASGWAILGPGTSGYALESGGAGADPSYQAIATTLAGLTDATITTPAGFDLLSYNSGTGKWINRTTSAQLDNLSSTQGAVLYRSASGWVALGPGTNGQVLTTGGAAANPSWAPAVASDTPWSIDHNANGHALSGLTAANFATGANRTITGPTNAYLNLAPGTTGFGVRVAGNSGATQFGLQVSNSQVVLYDPTSTTPVVEVSGGAITLGAGDGNDTVVQGRTGTGGQPGTGVQVVGGTGDTGAQGGTVQIIGGNGGALSSTGGDVLLRAGHPFGGPDGAALHLVSSTSKPGVAYLDTGASGTTPGVGRQVWADQVYLTNSTATAILTVDLNSFRKACGGYVDAVVYVDNGTHVQVLTQRVFFTAATDDGAAYTTDIQAPAAGVGNSQVILFGTLTATWTATVASHTLSVKCTATSSLASISQEQLAYTAFVWGNKSAPDSQ